MKPFKKKKEDRVLDKELTTKIKSLLDGRPNRWLLSNLISLGHTELNDVKISNKLNCILGISKSELNAINKIFNTNLKFKTTK